MARKECLKVVYSKWQGLGADINAKTHMQGLISLIGNFLCI